MSQYKFYVRAIQFRNKITYQILKNTTITKGVWIKEKQMHNKMPQKSSLNKKKRGKKLKQNIIIIYFNSNIHYSFLKIKTFQLNIIYMFFQIQNYKM